MRRLLLILLISIAQNAFAMDFAPVSLTLQQKKDAFLKGFMNTNITGTDVRNEFKNLNSSPEEFNIIATRMLKQTSTPILTIAFRKQFDALGRLVISPEFRYQMVSPEVFPGAAYIYSLLNFQKDATILQGAPKLNTPEQVDVYEMEK